MNQTSNPRIFLSRWVLETIRESDSKSLYLPFMNPETIGLAVMWKNSARIMEASAPSWLDWQECRAYIVHQDQRIDIDVIETLTEGIDALESAEAFRELVFRAMQLESEDIRSQSIAALRNTERYMESMKRAQGRVFDQSVTAMLGYYTEVIKNEIGRISGGTECRWEDPEEAAGEIEVDAMTFYLPDPTERFVPSGVWKEALEDLLPAALEAKGGGLISAGEDADAYAEALDRFLSRCRGVKNWVIAVNDGFLLDPERIYEIIASYKTEALVLEKKIFSWGREREKKEYLFSALDAK